MAIRIIVGYSGEKARDTMQNMGPFGTMMVALFAGFLAMLGWRFRRRNRNSTR